MKKTKITVLTALTALSLGCVGLSPDEEEVSSRPISQKQWKDPATLICFLNHTSHRLVLSSLGKVWSTNVVPGERYNRSITVRQEMTNVVEVAAFDGDKKIGTNYFSLLLRKSNPPFAGPVLLFAVDDATFRH